MGPETVRFRCMRIGCLAGDKESSVERVVLSFIVSLEERTRGNVHTVEKNRNNVICLAPNSLPSSRYLSPARRHTTSCNIPLGALGISPFESMMSSTCSDDLGGHPFREMCHLTPSKANRMSTYHKGFGPIKSHSLRIQPFLG